MFLHSPSYKTTAVRVKLEQDDLLNASVSLERLTARVIFLENKGGYYVASGHGFCRDCVLRFSCMRYLSQHRTVATPLSLVRGVSPMAEPVPATR